MQVCGTCNQKIGVMPFRWHKGSTVFCSSDCLPEGVLDEPYALAYTGLLEKYLEFHSTTIEWYEERDELLDEIDYCLEQCKEFTFGDTEGFYYKERLSDLALSFMKLAQTVKDTFLNPVNYEYLDGLSIQWEWMKAEKRMNVAEGLCRVLQAVLDENNWRPHISYNLELNPVTECQNIVVFPDAVYGEMDELLELHEVGLKYLQEAWTGDAWIEDFFYFTKLCKCPLCTWPEPYEDFMLNENYHLHVCWSCTDKRRFRDE